MKTRLVCLTALAGMLAACVSPAPVAAPSAALPLTAVDISPGAATCAAQRTGPLPGLVFIGGSEGGATFARHGAEKACEAGFAALALPYWRGEGLPGALERIELDRFDAAIEAFSALSYVDGGAVGLVGYSRGSEAGMLVAADNADVQAVAGLAPGAVAGANIDFRDFFDNDAAWVRSGAPLDYVTVRPNAPGADWRDMMADQPPPSPARSAEVWAALQAQPGFEAAVLPVEEIAAPVLLIGAEIDAVWASCSMADFIAERRAGLRTDALCVPGAPHGFMAPGDEGETESSAAQAAWMDLFAFFDAAL